MDLATGRRNRVPVAQLDAPHAARSSSRTHASSAPSASSKGYARSCASGNGARPPAPHLEREPRHRRGRPRDRGRNRARRRRRLARRDHSTPRPSCSGSSKPTTSRHGGSTRAGLPYSQREQRRDSQAESCFRPVMLNEPGMERNHLEEGNHLDRGARRSARGHLRRVRCQAIPHHVVEPDQGRRRLAVRSLAGRPQGAARRERQQCDRGAAGPEGRRRSARRAGLRRPARHPGASGAKGEKGDKGDTGAAGDSYLHGAYYSVAYYDKGDTNGGAIATVACKAQTDTAISGGVSTEDYHKTVPVGQTLPGRMDWDTNTPKAGAAGRLDRPVRQPERLGPGEGKGVGALRPRPASAGEPDLHAVDRRLTSPESKNPHSPSAKGAGNGALSALQRVTDRVGSNTLSAWLLRQAASHSAATSNRL